jgi:hypothetical protein
VLWTRDQALDLGIPDIAPQVFTDGRVFRADACDPSAAAHAARCVRDAITSTVLDIDAPGPRQEPLLEAPIFS